MHIIITDTRSQISNNISRNPYTRKNRVSPRFSIKQAIFVPTSIEELGTPLELVEQDKQDVDKEKPVSPASKPCPNIVPPKFSGDSVPSSVEQQGALSTPKIPKTPFFGKCIVWPPKSGGIYISFSRDEEPDV